MDVPYPLTGEQPKISIWLDDKRDNVLKKGVSKWCRLKKGVSKWCRFFKQDFLVIFLLL